MRVIEYKRKKFCCYRSQTGSLEPPPIECSAAKRRSRSEITEKEDRNIIPSAGPAAKTQRHHERYALLQQMPDL